MFEALFGVSRDLLARGELVLMSDWPTGLLLLLLLTCGLALALMLARQRRALAPLQLLAIGVLQLGMLAVVLILLWQPGLRTEQLRSGDNVVAVMLDSSASMSFGVEGQHPYGPRPAVAERTVDARPERRTHLAALRFRRAGPAGGGFRDAARAGGADPYWRIPAAGAAPGAHHAAGGGYPGQRRRG